jgi:dephospho-CoA kinase
MSVKRIGIAGFMGAGKSTVARILAGSAGTIIDADREAKMLMRSSVEIRKALSDAFGSQVIADDEIRFDLLGGTVFSSREKILALNAIVHPPLIKLLDNRLESAAGDPVILDAALLPLWPLGLAFDACLWVHAPAETRFSRLQRLHPEFDEAAILERMRLQEAVLPVPGGSKWDRIENTGSQADLLRALQPFMTG